MIFAPFIGANLHRIGRKNAIIIGYSFCIFAIVVFGLISYLPKGPKVTVINEQGETYEKQLEGPNE